MKYNIITNDQANNQTIDYSLIPRHQLEFQNPYTLQEITPDKSRNTTQNLTPRSKSVNPVKSKAAARR